MKTWIVVLTVAGCCVALLAQSTRSASSQPSAASPAGRFQIVMSPSSRADTFLLDTATGHIWQRTKYTNLPDQPEVWQIQDRVDSRVELLAWAADHMPKPAATPPVAPPAPPSETRPRQITDE